MDLKTYAQQALATEHTAEHPGQISIRLQHAITGFVSEVSELIEFRNSATYHTDELFAEVGDCLWYVNLGLDDLNATLAEPDWHPRFADISQAIDGLVEIAGKLADIQKKAMFYTDRPVDRDRVVHLFKSAVDLLNAIVQPYGGSLGAVAQQNIQKLRRRYTSLPEGIRMGGEA